MGMHSPFQDDRLNTLLSYWQVKAEGRAAPERGEIDPIEIPQLLPILFLLDVGEEETPEEGARFRLVGTALVAQAGRELKGTLMHQHGEPTVTDPCADAVGVCVREQRPVAGESTPCWLKRPGDSEWVLLPLTDENGDVSTVLGAVSLKRRRPEMASALASPLAVAAGWAVL